MKLAFLFLFLFACPQFIFAQGATLAELVDLAMQNSPETKKAWSASQRAAAYEGSVKSRYYPKIDLDLQAEKGKTFQFINGPDTKYTEVGADLSLSMLLFDFGERRAEARAAACALKAANWEADFALQKVLITVLEDAYELLHVQEVLHADAITLEDAKKLLEYAQAMHQVGLAPISDVYTTLANVSQLEIDVKNHKADQETKRGKLLATIGQSYNENFTVASINELPQPKREDLEALLKRAKAKHAELLAKQAKTKQAAFELEKEEASFLPKLSAKASGGFTHFVHDHTKSANYEVGLDLKIPLFAGFESVYKARMARAQLDTTLSELALAELEIAQQVLSSQTALKAAEESLPLATHNVKNCELAYAGALEKYRAGQKNMIHEVSSALQQLAKARLREHDVKTKWLVSIAKLAYATGTLDPKEIK